MNEALIKALSDILGNNLNNRITVEVANGICMSFDQFLKSQKTNDKPVEVQSVDA